MELTMHNATKVVVEQPDRETSNETTWTYLHIYTEANDEYPAFKVTLFHDSETLPITILPKGESV